MQRGQPDKGPEEEYCFHHILIQQAAYRAIPKSARAELHHRYADWLEYVAREPVTRSAEILGYHLSSPSVTATNCGPPKPNRPRCRAGRPHISSLLGAPRMTAATRSRQ